MSTFSKHQWSLPKLLDTNCDSKDFLEKLGFRIIPNTNSTGEIIEYDESDPYYPVNPPSDAWSIESPDTQGTSLSVSNGEICENEKKIIFTFSQGKNACISLCTNVISTPQ